MIFLTKIIRPNKSYYFSQKSYINSIVPVLNKFSSKLTQDESLGAAKAMLYAVGLKKNDFDKPQVGVASVWLEGNPCNMHLLDLANSIKQGINKYGMIGLGFNTIGMSDGMSMGTDGMKYSLQSRDIIADSIETVMKVNGMMD